MPVSVKRKSRPAAIAGYLFFSIFLVLLAGSVSAVKIEVTNFAHQDAVDVGDRFIKADVKVTCTGNKESGIVELGLHKAGLAGQSLAFFSPESPCEATFPWNTHASYNCGSNDYEFTKFYLLGRNIPDGAYKPYLIHASGCFNAGGDFKQPDISSQASNVVWNFGDIRRNEGDQCDNPYTALQYVQRKGDIACQEALCYDAASGSSEAKCVKRAVCGDGAEQLMTCNNQQSIVLRNCVGGQWVETGAKCSDYTPPIVTPPPITPVVGGGGVGGLVLVAAGVLVSGWGVLFLLKKSGLVRL